MPPKPILDSVTFRRLVRARDFAAARFDRPISVSDLAAVACLSPWHFHRLFTAAFGETPHAFVSRLRLDRAQRVLAGGNVSVTDACFEVGYLSVGSFSTWFRSATGMSPSAFRHEIRRFYGVHAPWRFAHIPSCFLGGWRIAG
jgi:AraC-like DNA-binding protein